MSETSHRQVFAILDVTATLIVRAVMQTMFIFPEMLKTLNLSGKGQAKQVREIA
jgi:hypothetical protein